MQILPKRSGASSQPQWGPDLSAIPAKFKDIPYAPFSKLDKVGRVADWYNVAEEEQQQQQQSFLQRTANARHQRGRFQNQQQDSQSMAYGAGAATAFTYVHEDDASFSVVDRTTGAAAPSQAQMSSGAGAGGKSSGAWGSSAGGQRSSAGAAAGRARGVKRYGNYHDKHQRLRETSILIAPNWKLIDEYPLQTFLKAISEKVEPVDVAKYGNLNFYDRSLDRVTARLQKPLKPTEKVFHVPTASDDKVLQGIVKSKKLPDGTDVSKKHLVFTTAQILAVLMTSPRAVNSWDIVITTKTEGGQKLIFFDKRDDSSVEYVTVSETSAEPPADVGGDKEHIQSPGPLATEATFINKQFSQHVATKDAYKFGEKNPFGSAKEDLASLAYRYRRFELKPTTGEENGVMLIARTELDSVQGSESEPQLLTVNALNEYYPVDAQTGVFQANYKDWRSKLDSQRGAVMASEIRNNAAKVARWALEAVLADADLIKIGFVTRNMPTNPSRGHTLLGVQHYRPQEFATQLNLSMSQCWGIIKSLVEMFLHLDDGRYILLKDPNQHKVKLYRVPEGAKIPDFDDDGHSDTEEEPNQ